MSADDFFKLKAAAEDGDSGSGITIASSGVDRVQTLADWIDEAVILCDVECRVTYANRIADALCRADVSQMTGRPLFSAIPAARDTLLETHVHRVIQAGEPMSADFPSPFREDAWLKFQCFPLGGLIALMFRDITTDVHNHRMADKKGAILEAFSAFGSIYYVRISVRGTIDAISDNFCEALGLPMARLIGAPLVNLIVLGQRVEFGQAVKETLRSGASRRVSTTILCNRRAPARMGATLVHLRGAYGCEGAIVVGIPEEDLGPGTGVIALNPSTAAAPS